MRKANSISAIHTNIVCLKAEMLEEDQLDSSNIFDAFSFIKYKVRKEIDE
jgi:hypothetical protein